MLIDHYRAMARYNRWMNQRLYALAAELSDEERKRDLGAFFKSIHGTLNHILLADRVWLGRLAGDPASARFLDGEGRPIAITALSQVLYDDFAALTAERARADDDLDRFLASLDDDALAKSVSYKNMSGVPASHPLWWAISHCFNHQTHHRGQATTLFKQLGRDPGVTDLIHLLRSEM